MNRRDAFKVLAGATGVLLLPGSLMAQNTTPPPPSSFNLTVSQTGDYTGVPTAGIGGLGTIGVGDLPNIDSYKVGDLPNIAYLPVQDVPGLAQALGVTYCDPNSTECQPVLVGDVPGLLDQSIADYPDFKDLSLGQLPGFNEIAGYNLSANLSAVTWDVIPGLLNFTLNVFLSYIEASGVVPSIVELITYRQYPCFSDGVLYVISRGQPWQVGEYRYLTPNFRVRLDSIIDHGPGTGYFHSEVLVCFFGCFWLGPFPWPNAYEQQIHLWLPPVTVGCSAFG
jgi:hypothetical protein